MKDLYVKIGSKGKDWAEVEIYTKVSQAKGCLAFSMVPFRFSVVNGLMCYQQSGKETYGFLCARCKTVSFSHIADGHIEVKQGKGLCAMCASTEEIFKAYVGTDDKGEYAWLPDAEKKKRWIVGVPLGDPRRAA